jgi:photosynthetic reaction center cytochrome c subunit
MKLWWTLAVAGMSGVWVGGVVLVERTAAQGQPSVVAKGNAGETFKNVSTSTLKGLSVDVFINTMGVIADDLGLDCADCHPNAGTDQVDWVIDTPPKRTARRMIEMVATINRTNFGGVQRVTCWTCHHGRDIPASTIALDSLYESPNAERDDILKQEIGEPPATQVLDKYIAALGGAQRLAGLNSFIATGVSIGYAGLGGNGDFSIYAKAPNQRTTLIKFKDHPERGESTWAFGGLAGWIKTPRGLLGEYDLIGGELDGARLEAQMAFPGQIKQVLTNWRVGAKQSIGDRDFQVVQGTGPRDLLATLYFDPQTGLLTRLIRYSPSPVGRMPTQIDYSDYRDVGGIKFPFEYTFKWLDGRYTAKITDVKTNVPIDPAIFGKPSARPGG